MNNKKSIKINFDENNQITIETDVDTNNFYSEFEGKDDSFRKKTTYCLGRREYEMINLIYIKRLKRYGKADKSQIVRDGIRLIFEKEGF